MGELPQRRGLQLGARGSEAGGRWAQAASSWGVFRVLALGDLGGLGGGALGA